MADIAYASPSTSQANLRAVRWPLDSPQNSAKRPRRRSVVEQSQLLEQIQKEQDEIAALKQGLRDMHSEGLSDDESDEGRPSEEDGDIAALEAMLKEMDDGALASLLTENIAPTSMQALLPYLGEEKMAILPPAKSAGVEGTGSGLQLDEEAMKLDREQGSPTEDEAEAALMARLERGEELLGHLSTFSSIDFHTMTSSVPNTDQRDQSKLLRKISMKGKLTRGLGDIKIELKVGEDVEQRTGPQIVSLDVEVGDELYRALGQEHLQSFIQERNLPAVMLSIRTLLPMAETRLRLFQSIALIFPLLAKDHLRRKPQLQAALEGKRKGKTMSVLVDPAVMEKLSLQNQRGAQLDITFAIRFNRWGHAVPSITVTPSLPTSLQVSSSAQEILQDLPTNFAAFYSHATSPLDVGPTLVTTIQAFFGLD